MKDSGVLVRFASLLLMISLILAGSAVAYRPHPYTVGNGTDYNELVSTYETKATGTFTAESGFTSESDSNCSTTTNCYSLQMNAYWTCTAFGGSGYCLVQFVFVNHGNGGSSGMSAVIQQWSPDTTTACPSGWTTVNDGDNDWSCFRNDQTNYSGNIVADHLTQMTLVGMVSGTSLTVTMTDSKSGSPCASGCSTTATDGLGTSGSWDHTEFNIFGGAGTATFNSGTSLTIDLDATTVHGSPTYSCVTGGITGEQNNLNLGSNCTVTLSHISFTEHN